MLHKVHTFLFSPTGRLAASYLGVIMVMSIGFSIVLYNTSVQSLRRTPPSFALLKERTVTGYSGEVIPQVSALLEERAIEGERALLVRLVFVNIATLGVGAVGAFFLARKTLRPIERNIEAQEQFVSDASHELRTPLASLQAASEVALRRTHLTEDDARATLAQNIEETERLKQLTDSLLKLANTTEPSRSPVTIASLVEGAVTAVSSKLIEKEIVIKTEIPDLTVQIDERSFSQAIAIIMDNAVKYSKKRSTIWVTAYKSGGYGFLSIRDEGKGIAEKDMPYIFDRFYRADQARDTPGHGIGLALAKKIVLQHGGDIEAKSSLGVGSEFTLKIILNS